ncbi:MAG: hypothetical protein JWP75_3526 [Frondihabitans sp.]|nr:hypothetical protein [Frondihabitans sp.]
MPITKVEYNLSEVRRDQEQIFAHIGRFTVAMSAIDQTLTRVHSSWAQIVRPDETFVSVENFPIGEKLEWIKKDLPVEWPARDQLIASLKDLIAYRNRLDHSAVHGMLSTSAPVTTWVTMREKTGLAWEPLVINELPASEDKAFIVQQVLMYLATGGMMTVDVLINSSVLKDVFPDAERELRESVAKMFPIPRTRPTSTRKR